MDQYDTQRRHNGATTNLLCSLEQDTTLTQDAADEIDRPDGDDFNKSAQTGGGAGVARPRQYSLVRRAFMRVRNADMPNKDMRKVPEKLLKQAQCLVWRLNRVQQAPFFTECFAALLSVQAQRALSCWPALVHLCWDHVIGVVCRAGLTFRGAQASAAAQPHSQYIKTPGICRDSKTSGHRSCYTVDHALKHWSSRRC